MERGEDIMAQGVTRGGGLLEGFLATMRARRAQALIPGGLRAGRILDIGCGTHPLFLDTITFSEKFGLDKAVSDEACVRWKNRGILLDRADMETEPSLPFEEDFFDVVTMLAVLEHLTPAIAHVFLRENYRVLKPGGFCVVTTPAPWTGGLLKFLARVSLVSSEEIEDHKVGYTPLKVRDAMTGAGFDPGMVCTGYFEAGMNIWARATK
jgi:SAM-dependent methyltransferase